MHAIINHLPIKPDTDWPEIAAEVDSFNASINHQDFRGFCLIRAGDNEAILLALFATRSALDEVSREFAAPWFGEKVKPHLAGPVSRSTGEIIAGALRS